MTIKSQAQRIEQIKLQKILDNQIYILGRIWGKLRSMDATNLDDKQIERVFRNASLPSLCIKRAKFYREIGALYFENNELKYSEQILTEWYHVILKESISELCRSDLLDNLVTKHLQGKTVDHTKAALNIALRAISKSFIENISGQEAIKKIIEANTTLCNTYLKDQEFIKLVQEYVYNNLLVNLKSTK